MSSQGNWSGRLQDITFLMVSVGKPRTDCVFLLASDHSQDHLKLKTLRAQIGRGMEGCLLKGYREALYGFGNSTCQKASRLLHGGLKILHLKNLLSMLTAQSDVKGEELAGSLDKPGSRWRWKVSVFVTSNDGKYATYNTNGHKCHIPS